jgi:Tfp pilus assembly protein PilV
MMPRAKPNSAAPNSGDDRVGARGRAFSLTEIVIALGIFSFAIISILGLLLSVTKSNAGAATDTVLAQMAGNTMTQLRSKDFAFVHSHAAYGDATPDFYFDVAGKMARDPAGNPATTPDGDSIFGCVVTRSGSSSSNMDFLVLDFRWPISAPSASQQSRKLTSSMAKYD